MISSPSDPAKDAMMPAKQKPSLSSQRNLENMRSNLYFGVILVMCIIATWLFARIYREAMITFDQNGTLTLMEYSWLFRLCLNLAGYATILVPGLLLYMYLKRINYFDKYPSSGYISGAVHAMFGEPLERLPESTRPVKEAAHDADLLELAFCFTGLMLAYLLWGLLQEKIMTQKYVLADGSVARFSDSQLLVLINRLAAFLLALGYLVATRRPLLVSPLYKFSYCSLTNIVSAWCQYEALKYVSFPTQVLSKSCKVILVMVMGKLVSRNKYEVNEYITAAAISAGMVMFMTGSRDDNAVSMISTWSGACLLAVYMVCDSFTSSWQDKLFNKYEPAMQPTHMVCGVSAWSCVLSLAAIAHQPAHNHAAAAALAQSPMFIVDCVLLCASSSLGQLLIYRTIAKFGAVVFIIIMTCRQAVSILLSCAVYGHRISASGVAGVVVVFAAVAARLYFRQRRRRVPI